MTVKISSLMIGLVLCSLGAILFSNLLFGFSSNYDIEYDNSSLDTFNKLSELSEKTDDVRTDVTGLSEKEGVLDLIGGFFSDTLGILKDAIKSIDILILMIYESMEILGLGPMGSYIASALITILLIAIFVGVFVSAILKWRV